MNIRIWKAKAAQKLGKLTNREQKSLDYLEKLKEKYQHHPQILRISRHRNVPGAIRGSAKAKREILQTRRRKRQNLARHSASGTVPKKTLTEEKVIEVVE